MKSHEAEAVITLLRRSLAVNETGDTFERINNDFYKTVVTEKTPEENHAACKALLRRILEEITATLDFAEGKLAIGHTRPVLGLDYRSLQHQIRELLK